MAIQTAQTAPDFTVTDVHGDSLRLSALKGKKVLLTFYRNAGCPVCNFRFHELQQQDSLFRARGLVVLAVYESSAGKIRSYLNGARPYARMIANPDQSLYQLYHIEKSMGKVLNGMFHGAMTKMKKGKALFTEKISQDGSTSRIGADFLIYETGQVQRAYYGRYLGDHLPIEDILAFLETSAAASGKRMPAIVGSR